MIYVVSTSAAYQPQVLPVRDACIAARSRVSQNGSAVYCDGALKRLTGQVT
jgi:hypothetical protein